MAFDIHIEGVPEGEVKGTRFLTFGNYERTLAVQGVQKMVNRYLKCLCTPKGTDISDSEYGTDLMNMFLGNVDKRSLQQLVSLAVRDAESRIQQYDVDNGAPIDERLANVTIEGIEEDTTNIGFDLTLVLGNIAGTKVRVLVPSIPTMAAQSVSTE